MPKIVTNYYGEIVATLLTFCWQEWWNSGFSNKALDNCNKHNIYKSFINYDQMEIEYLDDNLIG